MHRRAHRGVGADGDARPFHPRHRCDATGTGTIVTMAGAPRLCVGDHHAHVSTQRYRRLGDPRQLGCEPRSRALALERSPVCLCACAVHRSPILQPHEVQTQPVARSSAAASLHLTSLSSRPAEVAHSAVLTEVEAAWRRRGQTTQVARDSTHASRRPLWNWFEAGPQATPPLVPH